MEQIKKFFRARTAEILATMPETAKPEEIALRAYIQGIIDVKKSRKNPVRGHN
jgi:hypothetical protein